MKSKALMEWHLFFLDKGMLHLKRLIKKHDLDMIYIPGPGHGGPGPVPPTHILKSPWRMVSVFTFCEVIRIVEGKFIGYR